MTPLAPNPQSYPRTPSPKSELTAAPACFEGLAQALRWLELRQMQPHSWQVFSGSSLMWRSAWYCFLHWCLPLVCGRKCPCAWQPLGLALRFATCCLDSTASLEVPLLHTKRAPQLLWLFLSYPHSPSVPSQCMQATYSISVTSPARLALTRVRYCSLWTSEHEILSERGLQSHSPKVKPRAKNAHREVGSLTKLLDPQTVITRGTTFTKNRSQCPTICDDTGFNSYSFIVLFFLSLLLSQCLFHIQHPCQKWHEPQFRLLMQTSRSTNSSNSCSTGASFKMRQLKAKGGKKLLGSHSSFGALEGRQSPVPLCNSLHK